MAWPECLETIPMEDPPSGLEHGDIHLGNILIGDGLADAEHRIAPIFKLIDFGRAWYRREPTWLAEENNVHRIGRAMVCLIDLHNQYQWGDTTFASFPQSIDPVLLTLVRACLDYDMNTNPRFALRYLLENAERHVANPADSYKDRLEEQDAAVSQLWRELVYNAPSG
ncbi:hypothetical protein F4818DRAFT_445184 [Hypoxylon cercidicola]|nr:hypothetical protein F4818DRAFT_445184 [Hypoxylon cercidicola]